MWWTTRDPRRVPTRAAVAVGWVAFGCFALVVRLGIVLIVLIQPPAIGTTIGMIGAWLMITTLSRMQTIHRRRAEARSAAVQHSPAER